MRYKCWKNAPVNRAGRQALEQEGVHPLLAAVLSARGLCSVEQVERAIRTAIQRAWNQRDEQIWKLYFVTMPDGSVKRPSNSEFISRLAEQIICQYRVEEA